MNKTRIRVLVASGEPEGRERLSGAVVSSELFELAGEVEAADGASERLSRLQPDVVLLGIDGAQADATALIKAFVGHPLGARVLLISDSYPGSAVYEAVRLGARGALRRETSDDAVRDAIAAVARGELVLASREQAALGREIRLRGGCEVPRLSEKEREALALAEQGFTIAYIAHRMDVSPSTIRTYFERIYKKLGVPNKTAAVAKAIRNGWLGAGAATLVLSADGAGWEELVPAAIRFF